MNWRKFTVWSTICLLGFSVFAGCGNEETSDNHTSVKQEMEEQTEDTEENTRDTEEATIKESETDNAIFAQLSKCDFIYASGAGAWSTELKIREDGSFSGSYSDLDMGDATDEYPGGVCYVCDFKGQFAAPEKINEYTYKTSIEKISLKDKIGKEEIADDVKYIYSAPYGLDEAKDIYIYVKGAPVSQLPENYLSWVNYSMNGEMELPFYGIYNEKGDAGFSGWEATETGTDTDQETSDAISDELARVEKQAEAIEDKLQNEALTQFEMNKLSSDLYTLWDDELNTIWKKLKTTLDTDTMQKLTEEERQWIKDKDKQVESDGDEVGDGTARPMVEAMSGAELTKDRVYELAEYLK